MREDIVHFVIVEWNINMRGRIGYSKNTQQSLEGRIREGLLGEVTPKPKGYDGVVQAKREERVSQKNKTTCEKVRELEKHAFVK